MKRKVSGRAPLAFICSFFRLLQLLQSGGQSLLGSVQFLLYQLDAPVQGRHFSLSLDTHEQRQGDEFETGLNQNGAQRVRQMMEEVFGKLT